MDIQSKIILIFGPTASGKSKFAIKLAKRINGEIINADSMQVYKELKILTDRPKNKDLKIVIHHLYGFLNVKKNFSTGQWLKIAQRKIKELSVDEICEIWIDVQKKSLGPSIKFNDDYKYFWSYIPHFIHSPFYVYAYAFGDCLVNSLFNVYESKLPKFEDKYITLLESGGSDTYDKLLKPFGLNPKKKDFWQKGVNVIENLIDQLEE